MHFHPWPKDNKAPVRKKVCFNLSEDRTSLKFLPGPVSIHPSVCLCAVPVASWPLATAHWNVI